MHDKFRSLEASLSAEQHEQVLKLLSGKRPLAEVQEELARILGPQDDGSDRLKMKTCGRCDCQTNVRTCTIWVLRNGKWHPQVVILEECTGFSRFIGCLLTTIGL